MSIETVIEQRRTVHKYRNESISNEIIKRALDLALMAPNHKLTFPWRFTSVGHQTRQKIVDLGIQLKGQPECQADREKLSAKILNPSHLIVVSCVRCEDDFRARENYATVACAIQNMSLYLWGEGVCTKWSTGKLTYHEKTYEILGISKEFQEIVGFLWAGVADQIPEAPKRPPLSEVYNELP